MIEILMFHRVLPQNKIDKNDAYFIRGTLISQERLIDLIQQYLNNGFLFKTVSELNLNTNTCQVALTFDDGYKDNFLYVKPILDKFQLKATFYPIIGYSITNEIAPLDYYYQYVNKEIPGYFKEDWITGNKKKHFLSLPIKRQIQYVKTLIDDTLINKDISYMSIEELKTLHNLGHEIGGHSLHHDIYTNFNEFEIKNDIKHTLYLFSKIGINIQSYAYTDGQYNLKVIEILKLNNIQNACAIQSKKLTDTPYFELNRKFVTEHEII